jgi:hypothetical protein
MSEEENKYQSGEHPEIGDIIESTTIREYFYKVVEVFDSNNYIKILPLEFNNNEVFFVPTNLCVLFLRRNKKYNFNKTKTNQLDNKIDNFFKMNV